MKISVNKLVMADILSKVQGITSKKAIIPAISAIRIDTCDGYVKISATDLDTAYVGYVPADIEEEGTICVNSRKLFEIVKAFPDDRISIVEQDMMVDIKNKSINFNLIGIHPDDFPEIPEETDYSFFELSAMQFKDMINKTCYISTDKNEKRAHITGVLMQAKSGFVEMCSTDSRRLAVIQSDVVSDIPDFRAIVPKSALIDIAKTLDTNIPIQIGIGSKLMVKHGDNVAITSLLEGDFPEFSALTDCSNHHRIVADNKTLMSAIKRVSIVADAGMRFKFFNDITLAASNDQGKAIESVKIKGDGVDIDTAYNQKFWLDALALLDNADVDIYIKDESNPCMVMQSSDFINVIMPMKI